MIIVFRQVCQHQKRRLAVVIALKKFRQRRIGKMALLVHDPLLHHPWVRPCPQHLQIMV
jgi:hypothetical protein